MPETPPISWRSIPYGTPVTATDGVRVGVVRTELTRSQIDRLPAFDETATYHLASVGWLRTHLGWRKDARSDEEPG